MAPAVRVLHAKRELALQLRPLLLTGVPLVDSLRRDAFLRQAKVVKRASETNVKAENMSRLRTSIPFIT
jgi:hypothetical protein